MKFIFNGYDKNIKGGQVVFNYRLEKGNEYIDFSEKLSFSSPEALPPEEVLKPVLDSLSLAFGISYWKLYCPKDIQTPTINLSKKQAEFWNIIYTKGLGEFYYKNKIDFRGLVYFPFTEATNTPIPYPRKNRSLVGIGGGKDSVVSAELLKGNGKQFAGFMLNPHPIQENIVKLLGVEAISLKRELDPKFFELNKREDTYNGHVPISMIYAFAAIFAAVLYDYRYVVVSNEKSANYGNVEYLGTTVNHQWSKSGEFEELLQNYTKLFITPDVTYFSLLRQYYELKIAKIFTNYPQYFPFFSSCNTNFTQRHEEKPLWCGKCPKCAFVFSQLAAFLPKETVIKIFGQNLFDSEDIVYVYEELLGIKNTKPFDCVGTSGEVKLAFLKAYEKGYFKEDLVMKMFETEVLPGLNEEDLEKEVFSTGTSNIPDEFKEVINL